jgi:ribonuclease HI
MTSKEDEELTVDPIGVGRVDPVILDSDNPTGNRNHKNYNKKVNNCKNNNRIDLFQLNMHHCKNSNLAVALKMQELHRFIFFIQEPFNDIYCNLRYLSGAGRKIIKTNNTNLSARAAIVYSENVPLVPLPHLCDRDTAVGCLEYRSKGGAAWQKKNVMFISSYWDGKIENIPRGLNNAIEYAELRNWDYEIFQDSNSHSTLFGSPTQDKRGDLLETFMAEHDLYPNNVGSTWTFEGGVCSSVIDVTYGTANISNQIYDWRVLKEDMSSDHNLIAMSLNVGEQKYEYTRDLTRINWNKFRIRIEEEILNINLRRSFSLQELESATSGIELAIKKILDELAPVRKRILKDRVKFWTPRLDDLWHLRKELRRRGENILFKEVDRNFKRLKWFEERKAKRQRVSESNTPQLMAKLNKIINTQPKYSIGLLKKADGSFTNSIEESIELVLKKSFPGSTPYSKKVEEELEEISRLSNELGLIESVEHKHISVRKIKEAISSTPAHKACGPDEIKPIVLQNLPDSAIELLKDIYNGSVTAKYTPLAWRKANVIMIPKPGKPDYQIAKAFRPITLSNHIFKTLEKLTLWEITENDLKAKPLSKNQHAFRNNTSTESAALHVVTMIEEALLHSKKKFCVGVFADIEGAFDTVTGEAIIKAMKKKSIDDAIIGWYEQYIGNRIATLKVSGIEKMIGLSRGCPQGGCLSTLAWNLVADELLSEFDKLGITVVGFADDIALLVSGCGLGELYRRLNIGLRILFRWASERGLVISKEKTVGMIFTRKYKVELPTNHLELDGVALKLVNKVVYLGFTITSKLTWTEHVKNKVNIAKGKLFKYKSAIKANWGPPQSMVRWLYTGIVRPGITYGCLIWGSKLTETIKRELEKVQGLALMQQGLFRRNTPRKALNVISGVEPLHIFIYKTMLKAANRNIMHIKELRGTYPFISRDATIITLSSMLHRLKIPLNPDIRDRIPKERFHDRRFELKENALRILKPDISCKHINVFTDGSRIDDKTGYGFYIEMPESIDNFVECSEGMPNYCSVFQAEIRALEVSAEYLTSISISEANISFYVDSQAALLAITGDKIDSYGVLNAVRALDNLGEHNTVRLNWVKAHNGHEQNDRADLLAKRGALEVYGPVHPDTRIPDSLIKRTINIEGERLWESEWVNLEGHRQSKEFFRTPRSKQVKSLYKLNKAIFSMAVRWITGFNGLAYQNHKMYPNEFESPVCEMCELMEEQTSRHIISDCPSFRVERVDAFKVQMDVNFDEITTDELVRFLKNKRCRMLENVTEFPILFPTDYKKETNNMENEITDDLNYALSSMNPDYFVIEEENPKDARKNKDGAVTQNGMATEEVNRKGKHKLHEDLERGLVQDLLNPSTKSGFFSMIPTDRIRQLLHMSRTAEKPRQGIG